MTKFMVRFALGDKVRYTPRYGNPFPDLVNKEGEVVRVDIHNSMVNYLVRFDVPEHSLCVCSQEALELVIVHNSDDLYKVWRCNSEI